MDTVSYEVSLADIPLVVQAPTRLTPWAARIVASLPTRAPTLRTAEGPRGGEGWDEAKPPALILRVHDAEEAPIPSVGVTDKAALFHYDTFLYPRANGAWLLSRTRGGGAYVETITSKVQVWVPDVPPDDAEDWFSVTVMVAMALALRTFDRFHVHAALVLAVDGRWWGIAGESGAGKTTLTLALLAASGLWASDDAMFIAAAQRGVGWGWPRDFHVAPVTLAMFPRYRDAIAGATPTLAGKYRVGVGRAAAADGALPLAGWLFPQVSGNPVTTASRLTGAGAFGRLLTASAWAAFPELVRHRAHLEALQGAANLGPAWEIAMGSDMLTDPSVAARLVAGLPDPT